MRLALAGGGPAHLVALARWAKRPARLSGLDATLISDRGATIYSGAAPGVFAGDHGRTDAEIDVAALCRRVGVRFVERRITALDAGARTLKLEDGAEHPFDRLSVNVGGLQTDAPADPAVTPVRPLAGALGRWDELLRRSKTEKLDILVVGGGVAGTETALAMADGLADEGRIRLVAGRGGGVDETPSAARRILMRALARAGIAVVEGRVDAVAAGEARLDDGRTLQADDIFWLTGAKAAPWLQASGLHLGADGSPAVDRHLRSLSHPHVFVAGDAAHLAAGPAPKAGVYAVRQGAVLATNLPASCRGGSMHAYRAQRLRLSLIRLGPDDALALYGPFAAAGGWAMAWKRRIDGRFVRRLNALKDGEGA